MLKGLTKLEIPKNPEMINRFWLKVKKNPSTGCWEWQGKLMSGYGRITFNNITVTAHRFAYALFNGPIECPGPGGSPCIDHLCRNTTCVNPDHLELVSCETNLLRGESPLARNARKTQCPACNGDYRVDWEGKRYCPACKKARDHVRNAHKQAAKRATGWLPSHKNSKKTHCPQGHPYAGDNLYLDPIGNRHCKTCRRAATRKSQEGAS